MLFISYYNYLIQCLILKDLNKTATKNVMNLMICQKTGGLCSQISPLRLRNQIGKLTKSYLIFSFYIFSNCHILLKSK